ncbi:MAG TPA: matrixin family metalloprotease [Candidatus Polarisedimenticolaceae bacterium]|nr:matrixin family metalloprotease [Candidatus Polarisedimenticolaceae bacterium]
MRKTSIRILVVAVLAAAAVPAAWAYCLTGVKWPTPPDATMYYNSSGKVTSGQCISSSQLDTAVTGQIGTWKALTYAGTTSKKANRRDGQNTAGWANLGGQTLGITNYLSYGNPILTCGANSFYTALEIDVRVTTAFRWTSTAGSCPCAAGSAFYLNGIAQHEFGHAIGLCHTNTPSSLMYPSFGVCENKSKGTDENAGENALCY